MQFEIAVLATRAFMFRAWPAISPRYPCTAAPAMAAHQSTCASATGDLSGIGQNGPYELERAAYGAPSPRLCYTAGLARCVVHEQGLAYCMALQPRTASARQICNSNSNAQPYLQTHARANSKRTCGATSENEVAKHTGLCTSHIHLLDQKTCRAPATVHLHRLSTLHSTSVQCPASASSEQW